MFIILSIVSRQASFLASQNASPVLAHTFPLLTGTICDQTSLQNATLFIGSEQKNIPNLRVTQLKINITIKKSMAMICFHIIHHRRTALHVTSRVI